MLKTYSHYSGENRAKEFTSLAARLSAYADTLAQSPEPVADMAATTRACLAYVLWRHQGGSSPIGQPIRRLLGMGRESELSEDDLAAAKSVYSMFEKLVAPPAPSEAEVLLKRLEPFLDSIICYASTMSEYEGNALHADVTAYLKRAALLPGTGKGAGSCGCVMDGTRVVSICERHARQAAWGSA